VPEYRVDRDGVAHLRGGLLCPGAFNVSVIASLPTGVRPTKTERFPIVETVTGTIPAAYLTVQTDGEVIIAGTAVANSFFSLDGISFDTKH
jgi:hypothetical protein